MDFNTPRNRFRLILDFPRLADDPYFRLTSEDVITYNCIAFAMGFVDRWVQPLPPNGPQTCWWPDNVRKDFSELALLEAFEAVGFSATDDTVPVPDFDYAMLYSLRGNWTHASRLIANGVEHSKFGSLWNGYHSSHQFSGTIYGSPFILMRRPHIPQSDLIRRFPLREGTLTGHIDRLRQMLSKS